jgi:ATP-dependent Lhr-like helicase
VSPLKALAVDVERNLRAPLAGIARAAARRGDSFVTPSIAIRTGDTPAAERARFQRAPADILITTPESLYLLLTSNARDVLTTIETVIIDEIHALVPTKRGAHLALSLERLTQRCENAPQRIGLSATQRPLEEAARYLGGAQAAGKSRPKAEARSPKPETELALEFSSGRASKYRPVTIVDAGKKKALKLTIEVPVESQSAFERAESTVIAGGGRPSAWTAIHPRLLELIRTHRSTLIFVNSRRLAERLAGAINELAGETLVRSHHGSIAREQRLEIEDRLKAGALRALVATSSLELGIDMGAIDLVIQIEAPPSVASGLQRIGRGGHHIGAVSEGIIVPKFKGDLLACAAVAAAMHEGAVEAIRYPRNPLDIVAQHIVAMVAMDDYKVDDLFAAVRGAAPFADLSRSVFEGVLDMLSGRYPSDQFAELKPRITWDRVAGTLTTREGAKRVAIANGGTIPDRGLYGVFLVGAGPGSARVGELDEEMVFETHPGETFVLGASSWRVEEITHDRVLVSPAPGQPGKMPFWKGDRAGRPLELGLAIGRLTRDLLRVSPAAAAARLTRDHDLAPGAAEQLLEYLRDQAAASRSVPDADTVVVERVRDEYGDWRVCVLSPRGGPIHAPWAMAAAAKIREETGVDVETLWGDDGFVVRFPDVEEAPDPRLLMPDPDEVQQLVVGQLGATALFAGKFRENAARSLLLPKRRPGRRAPLWQQRKKAADLLAVASRYGSFPVILETYRECLRDFFDMPSLKDTLRGIRSRRIRVVTLDSEQPSPFAASLLFSYVASFLYDGDAPLAERRAQALAVDQTQLRELIGDAELRELLDAESIDAVEQQLQRLDEKYRAKTVDGVHDMLIALGDLTEDELMARSQTIEATEAAGALINSRRAIQVRLAGETRLVAVEDASRFRDALGTPLPMGLPEALLEPVQDPIGDLARRYARTHAPFPASEFAGRFGLGQAEAEAVLTRLSTDGELLEGEFRPGGTRREWTDAGVLRMIRRRSLARLRHEVEPVDHAALARFTTSWQGVRAKRKGADALLDAIEQLQGAPLPASILESEILAARVELYDPADLDAVIAAGEVMWVGVEPLGDRNGRVALYLADHLRELFRARVSDEPLDARETAMLTALQSHGASFFGPLHEAAGAGYPRESVDALWNLVWRGLVTNDTFHALRAFTHAAPPSRRGRRAAAAPFRSRRLAPASAEGRWTLVPAAADEGKKAAVKANTARAAAITQQLLARHGVLTREAVAAEVIPGGFGAVYPVLKALDESGRVRRGYFVAGLGATQFALPGALDLLRSLRDPRTDEGPEVVVLSATDPANPYGAALPWPSSGAREQGRGATRTIGATVILVDGRLAGYLARGDRLLLTWLPDAEPDRTRTGKALASVLIDRARTGLRPGSDQGGDSPRGMLIEEIDGAPPDHHPLAPFLTKHGFIGGAMGLQATFVRSAHA